jgi:large subunit ribosomal protein L6
MSRIGKKQITIPSGVNATLEGSVLSVVGPKGTLSAQLVDDVNLKINDNEIHIIPKDLGKRSRSMWGLTRTLISNLIVGVSDGYKKTLEIQGVGYRASVEGNTLKLALGFSHDVNYEIPKEVTINCNRPTEITVEGIDKQIVGQTAAEIRRYRPPEPYKGKGVRYKGEFVFRKEGKKK